MINILDVFKRAQKFTQKCTLLFDNDFQRSIDVMCKVIAYGHHGNNAMHYSTFSRLKDTISNKMALDGQKISTWSEFSSVFSESCDELQQYCIRDKGVLKELSSIASDVEKMARNRESLESKQIYLGNNRLHSAGLFVMMQNSASPFQFGNIIYPKQQRRLIN